jgi:hypothetical protein
LADSLKAKFGEDVIITAGKSGQFDVLAEGKLLFSKSETGRFPLEGEVEGNFAKLKGVELPPLEPAKPGVVGKILGKLRG